MCLADSACERSAEAEWGKGAEQRSSRSSLCAHCSSVNFKRSWHVSCMYTYTVQISTLTQTQRCWTIFELAISYILHAFYLSNSATYCFGHWPSKAFLGVRVSAGFQDTLASLAPTSLSTGRSVASKVFQIIGLYRFIEFDQITWFSPHFFLHCRYHRMTKKIQLRAL